MEAAQMETVLLSSSRAEGIDQINLLETIKYRAKINTIQAYFAVSHPPIKNHWRVWWPRCLLIEFYEPQIIDQDAALSTFSCLVPQSSQLEKKRFFKGKIAQFSNCTKLYVNKRN